MSDAAALDYDSVHEECGHRWRVHGPAGRSQGCYADHCTCREPRPLSVPDDPLPPNAIVIDPTAPETVAALAAAIDTEAVADIVEPLESGEVRALAAAILPAFVARLRERAP